LGAISRRAWAALFFKGAALTPSRAVNGVLTTFEATSVDSKTLTIALARAGFLTIFVSTYDALILDEVALAVELAAIRFLAIWQRSGYAFFILEAAAAEKRAGYGC